MRDEVEIEVADTGDGIAEQEREHVFEAFFRGGEDAARGSDGAGLGLAVLAGDHRDPRRRIWLASAASGTRIRFRLPRR